MVWIWPTPNRAKNEPEYLRTWPWPLLSLRPSPYIIGRQEETWSGTEKSTSIDSLASISEGEKWCPRIHYLLVPNDIELTWTSVLNPLELISWCPLPLFMSQKAHAIPSIGRDSPLWVLNVPAEGTKLEDLISPDAGQYQESLSN